MPKNIVQDVIPRESRRTIRDIPLSSGRSVPFNDKRRKYEPEESSGEQETTVTHRNRTEQDDVPYGAAGQSGGLSIFRHWQVWLLGIISAGVLIFVLGNYFSGAEVSVVPKSKEVNIDLSLTAKIKPLAGKLGYQTLILVKEESETIPADGTRPIESRASGKIIIYNNYSATSQRLVKNTRFETPKGLIYKIAESVTVPGRHSESGKILPGSIEVTVYAESAGEEYNIGLTDFTIPGFKSSPERFSSFYGRSKTAMTGGKIGTEKFVSDDKLADARKRLHRSLEKALIAEAQTQVPADSVLYGSAYSISFEPVIPTTKDKNNVVTIRERARFKGFPLKRDVLAKTIAEEALTGYDGSAVRVSNLEALRFKLKENITPFSETSLGPIEFSLEGSAKIIWLVDELKLTEDLLGKGKSELSSIAAKHPAVLTAEAVIRPVWEKNFPESASRIRISVQDLES